MCGNVQYFYKTVKIMTFPKYIEVHNALIFLSYLLECQQLMHDILTVVSNVAAKAAFLTTTKQRNQSAIRQITLLQ